MVQQEPNKSVAALRQTARDCIKDGRHTEAFFHLTHALKMDANNMELLNERSKCCSENLQYHFAVEDAKQMLELSPGSWLGHFRLGEIYLQTLHYSEALKCFQTAFQCQDSQKAACKEKMDKCRKEAMLDERAQSQLPWVGCALGIIMSSLLVVLDYLSFGQKSSIAHPLLKMLVCLAAAGLGYGGAILYRSLRVNLRGQLLEAPPDLLMEFPGFSSQKKSESEFLRPHQD